LDILYPSLPERVNKEFEKERLEFKIYSSKDLGIVHPDFEPGELVKWLGKNH
jgi:hypothetical protein